MRVRAWRLATVAVALAMTVAGAEAQEIRAFWADAFSPAIKSRAEVEDLLRRLRLANCNAVFVQVRKGGDAYYVSRYEPWASDNPERFDGLGYLIQRAHSSKPRIAVHAWINTCAVGRSRGNPRHVALAHPEWLSISDKGADYDNEATKIDPGNPDAADHTFRVYLDVARRYDVDGIHFDFVRYGGTEWGYNPVSVARFNARTGRTGLPKPTDPLWMQWRRDQVTALVRKVYAMAAAVRPRLVVSAATITWGQGPATLEDWNAKSAAMTRVFQDWRAWMAEGILDLNCLMSYYRETRHAAWFRLWIDWAKDHQYGRWAVPSSGIWLNSIADSLKQVAAIRAPSRAGNRPRGVLLYCYAATNAGPGGTEERYNEEFYRALSMRSPHGSPPFATAASEPAMPWKVRPKLGHVKGFVLDANSLTPVDGAIVRLSGPAKRTVRCDGTGFYAFVDVPRGRASVTVTAEGYAAQSARLVVAPGVVRDVPVMLGRPAAPWNASVGEAQTLRDGAPFRMRRAVVVGGSDHFADSIYVLSPGVPAALRVQLRPPAGPPFQAGDVVALAGAVGTIDGEKVIAGATAVLVDMQVPAKELGQAAWPVKGVADSATVKAPGVVAVTGVVLESAEEALTIGGASPVRVELAGRKDCGIEDEPSPIGGPAILSRVTVTGVATLFTQDGRTRLRVRPRTAADVEVLAGPGAAALLGAAGVLGPPFRNGPRLCRVEEGK